VRILVAEETYNNIFFFLNKNQEYAPQRIALAAPQ